MTQHTDTGHGASSACPWSSRLSEFIDGQLDSDTENELRRHLISCTECGDTVGDLRRVIALAGTLGPIDPPATAWPRIANRIKPKPARPTWLRMTMPQAIAAGLSVAIGSGALAWMLASGRAEPVVAAPQEPTVAALEANLASYDAALAEIEEAIQLEPDDPYLQRYRAATLDARAHLVDTAARLNLGQ